MNRFLYTEINVFAIAVLALMYQGRRKEFLQKDQIMFNRIILSMIFVLFLDTLTWVLNGLSFPYARIVCHIINGLFWFCSMIPCELGFLYGYYKLYGKSNSKITRIAILPVIYAAVFLLLNIYTGWVYTVSADNIYKRGPFYLLLGIVPFIHIVAAEILMIGKVLHVPMAERSPYKIMTAYLLLPLIGSAIQVAFYGASTIWVSLTIAVIVFYNYLQKGYISVDSLTGLANRRRFDSYTRGRMENLEKDAALYLLMLDINNFKGINDTFGHAQGDQVLVMTARMLLKASEGVGAFTARIGGDEFVIVQSDIKDEKDVIHKKEEVLKLFEQAIILDGTVAPIGASIGYSLFSMTEGISEMLTEADRHMYEEKIFRRDNTDDDFNMKERIPNGQKGDNDMNSIDAYISSFPTEVQEKLNLIRLAIKEEAPQAEEKFSYQMPTFAYYGNLVHFAAYSKHIGFYPAPSGIEAFKEELKEYKGAKGSVQFPLSKPIPYELIRKIVRFRVEENEKKHQSKAYGDQRGEK